MRTEPISKWICIRKENDKEFIEYIYAANWMQAEEKAKQKGWKLQGKFDSEHD